MNRLHVLEYGKYCEVDGGPVEGYYDNQPSGMTKMGRTKDFPAIKIGSRFWSPDSIAERVLPEEDGYIVSRYNLKGHDALIGIRFTKLKEGGREDPTSRSYNRVRFLVHDRKKHPNADHIYPLELYRSFGQSIFDGLSRESARRLTPIDFSTPQDDMWDAEIAVQAALYIMNGYSIGIRLNKNYISPKDFFHFADSICALIPYYLLPYFSFTYNTEQIEQDFCVYAGKELSSNSIEFDPTTKQWINPPSDILRTYEGYLRQTINLKADDDNKIFSPHAHRHDYQQSFRRASATEPSHRYTWGHVKREHRACSYRIDTIWKINQYTQGQDVDISPQTQKDEYLTQIITSKLESMLANQADNIRPILSISYMYGQHLRSNSNLIDLASTARRFIDHRGFQSGVPFIQAIHQTSYEEVFQDCDFLTEACTNILDYFLDPDQYEKLQSIPKKRDEFFIRFMKILVHPLMDQWTQRYPFRVLLFLLRHDDLLHEANRQGLHRMYKDARASTLDLNEYKNIEDKKQIIEE